MIRRATAWASPNIALVKYWGKKPGPGNKPAVSSLSMTLADIGTRTSVAFHDSLVVDTLLLNGESDAVSQQRVASCLDDVRRYVDSDCKAKVISENNFPTGAGLASSASGFAALVLAADAALGAAIPKAELSRMARRASGSAARSLWGGYVLLDATADDPCAEPLQDAAYFPLDVIIAVVSKAPKAVGSTDGMMSSQHNSDYYSAWLSHQRQDLQTAQDALSARDFEKLAEVSEASCLKMHALMMATRPPLIYWLPATLSCIQIVQSLRRQGTPAFFSIDAGPQVKVFCLPEAGELVSQALLDVPSVLELIHTRTGDDASLLDEGDVNTPSVERTRPRRNG